MTSQKGFSLIESLMVIVLVGVIVLLLANLPNAMVLLSKSSHLSLAREIASKQIEDKRAMSYGNLTSDDPLYPPAISDSRLSLLPHGTGVILVEDCTPSANPQFCPNGEHIKIITVTVKWKDNNQDQSINLKTFIGEGGINQ